MKFINIFVTLFIFLCMSSFSFGAELPVKEGEYILTDTFRLENGVRTAITINIKEYSTKEDCKVQSTITKLKSNGHIYTRKELNAIYDKDTMSCLKHILYTY